MPERVTLFRLFVEVVNCPPAETEHVRFAVVLVKTCPPLHGLPGSVAAILGVTSWARKTDRAARIGPKAMANIVNTTYDQVRASE